VRAPLRDQGAAYGRAAAQAGLTGALVDAVLELEKSPTAVSVHIVGDGGAALGDGFRKDLHHGLVQSSNAFSAQARGDGQGMYACPEQGFVGVDISHAADEALIEQAALAL